MFVDRVSPLILILVLAIWRLDGGEAAAPVADFQKRFIAGAGGELTTVQGDFRQLRRLGDLGVELKITGEFAFDRGGGRLLWSVREPLRYVVMIDDSGLVQWDADSGVATRLAADRLPWLRAMRELLAASFAADIERLDGDFALQVRDERTLVLTPASELFRQLLESIEVTCAVDFSRIERVVISEPGGDRVTIDFSAVRINETIPEETWRVPEG